MSRPGDSPAPLWGSVLVGLDLIRIVRESGLVYHLMVKEAVQVSDPGLQEAQEEVDPPSSMEVLPRIPPQATRLPSSRARRLPAHPVSMEGREQGEEGNTAAEERVTPANPPTITTPGVGHKSDSKANGRTRLYNRD